MEIGKINTLKIDRESDFGFFLTDEDNNEVLLPNAYINDNIKINDEIDVFIYKDSEDRIVATTQIPYIQLNEFAYLQVKDVNRYGAFIDWGLPKDLMVPYAEQKEKMIPDEMYPIFLLKDEKTNRLIGSNKINRYLTHDNISLNIGEEVNLLLYKMTDLGMSAIINNTYKGLIFKSDIHKSIHLGDKVKGYVKQIRKDGKIDLLLEAAGYKKSIDKNAEIILNVLKEDKGFLNLTDKSDPEEIKYILGMSKKAFKKGLGFLYKQKIIEILDDGIKLL